MSILSNRGPLIAALAAAALVSGCGGGGDGNSQTTGRVSVSLTDMPVDHADQVVIAVNGVAFKPEGSGPELVVDFYPAPSICCSTRTARRQYCCKTPPWRPVVTSGFA